MRRVLLTALLLVALPGMGDAQEGIRYYPPGASTILNVQSTATATSGTVEEVLLTYTIPAGTLGADGRGLRITAAATTAANTNAKTFRVRLGGLAGTQVGVHVTAASGNTPRIVCEVFRRAAAEQQFMFASSSNSDIEGGGGTAALDTTAAIVLVVTGQTAVSAGDLTAQYLIVELL